MKICKISIHFIKICNNKCQSNYYFLIILITISNRKYEVECLNSGTTISRIRSIKLNVCLDSKIRKHSNNRNKYSFHLIFIKQYTCNNAIDEHIPTLFIMNAFSFYVA